jgi:hypothetical protein
MKVAVLKHQFVTSVPENPEEGVLYVSLPYRTAIHKCCCGCGHEVVTPFSPTDWKLTFDGVAISLRPSIGNWSLPCRSHYWIESGKIEWAEDWSDERIALDRAHDRCLKERHYGLETKTPRAAPVMGASQNQIDSPRTTWWKRLAKMWS